MMEAEKDGWSSGLSFSWEEVIRDFGESGISGLQGMEALLERV